LKSDDSRSTIAPFRLKKFSGKNAGDSIRMVDLTKIKSAADWASKRTEIEQSVLGVLGELPRPKLDLQVKTVDEVEYHGYVRRRINYFVDPWERVAAWLFIPEGKEEVPAVLCCHSQVPQGKDEQAGLDGESRLAFAQYYAERGFVTLAPDCPTAGDRVSSRRQPYDSRSFYKDHPKMSIAGKMLHDHLRAVDVFNESKRVDTARVGVVGHGMGGANALLLTAFDDRVRACVASSGFTRFSTDKAIERWTGGEEGGLSLLPGLKAHAEKKDFPFDWEHILALAAPSAVLVVSSQTEEPLPNPKSVTKAVGQAAHVYKLLRAPAALDQHAHSDGDRITGSTQEVMDEWFDRWL
jgi:dienelactone hydrolase